MDSSYYKDIYNLLCKRHPNQKIYVISDHHFDHNNIIRYQRQEFNNITDMNEYIIKKHNSVVENDDIVIFLGDFSFKKSSIKDYLARMNGHKYLLLGNHDGEYLIRCYGSLGFEGIFINPVKINNNFFSHYPLYNNEFDDINFKLLVKEFNDGNGINYHGHLHNEKIDNDHFINVCCEVQDYKPLLVGYTEKLIKCDNLPLIINSKNFEDILKFLQKEKNVNPNLVISDYIYSMMLETITPYISSIFVYGSFPLYKKYGYISNFSDLDVCLIYNEKISKHKNINLLKEIFDTVFEGIKDIDNVDLSFNKIITNMRIFQLLYTNKSGNIYKGYFDINLVPLDIYRDTDFITTYDCSTLEKMLKNEMNLTSEFKFPKYESRCLTVNGDIANIMLQILFQQGHIERKVGAFKKLNYIYRTKVNRDFLNIDNLEDIMIRFFIRNISFFHMTRRRSEIDYINYGYKNLDLFMDNLPFDLKLIMEEILKNPNSLFNTIYKELSKINFEEIPQKSQELIKKIK